MKRSRLHLNLLILGMLIHRVVHSLKPHVAVIGGGASGIFAAIAAATEQKARVTVFEATSSTLAKVKISGGGRCNVMHTTDKSVDEILATGYPRGQRELKGLMHQRFPPTQMRAWFEEHGVKLKTEPDGRMFPITDSSQTVLDALRSAAEKQNVHIATKTRVSAIEPTDEGFSIRIAKDEDAPPRIFQAVILATGSLPAGYQLAKTLGHSLTPTVPSLFTLNTKHQVKEGELLHGLSGVSVPHAQLNFHPIEPRDEASAEVGEKKKKRRKKKKLLIPTQEGPLLITHHGLSGPAALRLSAFGARVLAEYKYRGQLLVDWAPYYGGNTEEDLWEITRVQPNKQVTTVCPLNNVRIPRRLWAALVVAAGIDETAIWAGASKKQIRSLAQMIHRTPLEMTGKGTFKEEFVTAGGVPLKELDMTTMESKVQRGLFCCGEVIDVDGVTGGFNFMNAWGTGYVAGRSAAAFAVETV